MTRIIFDARHMARPLTGLGRYTGCLLEALLQNDKCASSGIDVIVEPEVMRQSNPYWRAVEVARSAGRCTLATISARTFSVSHHWSVGNLINQMSNSVYFYPHFDLPISIKIPSIFVVHDLLPTKIDGYIRRWVIPKKLYFKSILKTAIQKSTGCVAVSSTTKADILDVVGEAYANKIKVVYEAPTGSFLHDTNAAEKNASTNDKYILYVGDRRPHKNLKRTIDVFARMKAVHGYEGSLILVGSPVNYEFDVDAYAASHPAIKITGSVTDLELARLYAGADALIFLSKYEGFGLPVLEAARYNTKIVVSDGGSLPEIAPLTACVVANSMSINDAAAMVNAYLREDSKIDNASYNARFSWALAAREIFEEFS